MSEEATDDATGEAAEGQVGVMSFQEHLAELRTRLIRVALVLAVGFFSCWAFREELFAFLSGPISRALADNGIYHFQAIEITESILVYLKTSFVAAVVLTSPLTFYQLWAFVSPGLLDNERRFVMPVTIFTVLFFLIGSAFAYRVILPFITDYLVNMTMEAGQAEVMVTLQNAYSTAFIFLLIFGLVFELPLVIFFLTLFGLVTAKGLLSFFRYFAVLSVLAGAILTPPDPVSQVLMAVPLNVLYLFGVFVAWGVERSRRGDEEQQPGAGATLTRLVGSSLVLLVLAGGLIVLFVRTLPQKDLTELLPEQAAWIVGGNPAILAESPAVDATLRRQTARGPWIEALGEADLELEDVVEAAMVGTADGERALMVRSDELGTKRAAVEEALPEGSEDAVGRVDEDTLALGPENLVQALVDAGHGDVDTIDASEEEDRLLQNLKLGGPMWAWLPSPKDRGGRFLGKRLAEELSAAGAWIRPGDPPRITLAFHATDKDVADDVETRLDALRTVQRGTGSDEHEALVQVTLALAEEIREVAPPGRRERIAKLEARLRDMAGPRTSVDLPAITSFGNRATGWALRRDDVRLELTAELEPDGLGALLEPLLVALR
ncbi:MAG: twin-arginine translocase subunit TatC [Myxococcota bacterium]